MPKSSTTEGITFPIDDVKPATSPLPSADGLEVIASEFPAPMYHSAGIKGEELLTNIGYHPLIAAVLTAFKGHYPLVLSPDIIWITIAQGISNHINCNAEELRDQFVVHQGKQELVVRVNELKKAQDWQNAFEGLVTKVKNGTKSEIASLLKCSFSTTGPIEGTVQDLMILNAFQKYFDYIIHCICGIPSIRLTGTVEDWHKITDRLSKIPEKLKLDWWTEELIPLCDQFVRAAKGKPDQNHWKAICKPKEVYGGTAINGWITRFIPYLNDEFEEPTRRNPAFELPNYGITTQELPRGLNATPATIMEADEFFEISVFAGFTGVSQNHQTLELEPCVGWFVQDAGGLRSTIRRIIRNKQANPPLAKSLIPPFNENSDFPTHLPGEYRMLYREADGISVGDTYRLLRFEELEISAPPNGKTKSDENDILRSPDWLLFCETAKGNYWVNLSGAYIHQEEKFPIYFVDSTNNGPILVALCLEEFLNLIEQHPAFPFHESNSFIELLVPPPISSVSDKRINDIEKGLVKWIKAANPNPPFRGVAESHITFLEDLWRFLLTSDGGEIKSNAGPVTLSPLDDCRHSGPSDRTLQMRLLQIGECSGYQLLIHPTHGKIIAADDEVAKNRKKRKFKAKIVAASLGEFLELAETMLDQRLNRDPDWITLDRY